MKSKKNNGRNDLPTDDMLLAYVSAVILRRIKSAEDVLMLCARYQHFLETNFTGIFMTILEPPDKPKIARLVYAPNKETLQKEELKVLVEVNFETKNILFSRDKSKILTTLEGGKASPLSALLEFIKLLES